nr:SDR family NAD(P)-dependent oxidoreductase [Sphingobium sp. SCG-1]
MAFITGAGSGIGYAIAETLAARGATIMIADMDAMAGEKAARVLIEAGRTAAAIACDVGEPESVELAVTMTCRQFGGIDILVNIAGLHLPHYTKRVSEPAYDAWCRLLQVNGLGIVSCAKACRESMWARRGRDRKHILNGGV